jgi:hypothetical protein
MRHSIITEGQDSKAAYLMTARRQRERGQRKKEREKISRYNPKTYPRNLHFLPAPTSQ